MTPSLAGILSKVRHAREHRDALDRYISETFTDEANRPVIGAKFEPESGDYVKYVSRMPDLEPFLLEVGLRVGDTVHDLRSALDHLMIQLALLHKPGLTPKQARSIQFPIADTPDDFAKQRRHYLRHIDHAHRTVFESFQPYDSRTRSGLADTYTGPWIHPLRLLRDLSNEDKHRVIITAAFNPGSYSSRGTTGTGALVGLLTIMDRLDGRVFTPAERLELGAILERGRAAGNVRPPDVEVDGDMTPAVCLPERRPVIQAIDRITAFVVHVIRQFESLF